MAIEGSLYTWHGHQGQDGANAVVPTGPSSPLRSSLRPRRAVRWPCRLCAKADPCRDCFVLHWVPLKSSSSKVHRAARFRWKSHR